MYFSLISESFFSDILEEASCSVPTHLDFRSILIVDAIFVIIYRRWLYDKYLITSDSEVSLSELLGECWSDLDLRMGYTIEYDEVIAEAVHFREGNSHRSILKYTYLIPPEFFHLCTLSYFDDFSIFSEEKFSGFREAIVSMSAHAGTIRSH